jgi:cobalt-zinc-cadmium efflux system outer membrane protein
MALTKAALSGLWLGFVFLAVRPAWGEEPARPPAPLTVEQAVEEAVQNNLALLAERVNLTIAEASLITARLRPNPVVSFSGDHLDLLGTGFNALNNGGPPEIAWRIDVPFERGHKRQLRVETAGYAKQIAEDRLLNSVRRLKLEVSRACIDVIEAKANLALQKDNLRTFEQLVEVNDIRVKAGSIAPLEMTRSRVAMLQFRGNVRRAELDLVLDPRDPCQ